VALDAFLDYLAWDLSRWEVYGLFFLLGSFVVATVSDVKHMSAQREFMDVWWAFGGVMLFVQLYLTDFRPPGPLVVKWLLVVAFALVSHRSVGLWLRLATADVAACVAAASLLSPGLVVVFFVALKLLSYPFSAVLARGRAAYPFMPVVTAATLVLVGGAFVTGVVG
jgi:hypothetical protein